MVNFPNKKKCIYTMIQIIGDKGKLIILYTLLDGTKRFGELRDATGISQKALTVNLRALEKDKLLTRKAYAEVPPRVEYTLTKAGYDLKPVFDDMFVWASGNKIINTEEGESHADTDSRR